MLHSSLSLRPRDRIKSDKWTRHNVRHSVHFDICNIKFMRCIIGSPYICSQLNCRFGHLHSRRHIDGGRLCTVFCCPLLLRLLLRRRRINDICVCGCEWCLSSFMASHIFTPLSSVRSFGVVPSSSAAQISAPNEKMETYADRKTTNKKHT